MGAMKSACGEYECPCHDRLKIVEAENRALAQAICPDGSITDHRELLDFCEDLHHAYGKLGEIMQIEHERDALAEQVRMMREAIPHALVAHVEPGHVEIVNAALGLDVLTAEKIAGARKRVCEAAQCCIDADDGSFRGLESIASALAELKKLEE